MQSSIYQLFRDSERSLALLVDPDKYQLLTDTIKHPTFDLAVDFIFLGGSLMTTDNMEKAVKEIKLHTSKPIVIFPGSSNQICRFADAFLLLSLISGRNADLLIGKHVEAAAMLQESGLELIPTAYMLIDGGVPTTASYISNTSPIPRDKNDIAAITALAGEMLGLSCTYLDAGSGAKDAIPTKMISAVRNKVNGPLIVGGGIKSCDKLVENFEAGANIVVMGNFFEENPNQSTDFLLDYLAYKQKSLHHEKI